MKKMTKKRWFILCLALLICLGGWLLYRQQSQPVDQAKAKPKKFVTRGTRQPDKEFYLFHNDDYIAIKGGSVGVGQRYVVGWEDTFREGDAQLPETKKSGYERYFVTYDMDNSFASKKYDIYQIVENYDKTYTSRQTYGVLSYQGVDHLLFEVIKQEKYGEENPKNLLLNLETGQVSEVSEDLNQDITTDDLFSEYGEAVGDTMLFRDMIDKHGIIIDDYHLKAIADLSPTQMRPDLNLFEDHPKLYKGIYEEDYVVYVRQGRVSPEEYFNTLLYWFAVKGGTPPKTYIEEDGKPKEPMISSYSDYEAWKASQPAE